MTFTLILFLYAGIWADGDSMAVTSVPNFKTLEACEAAGKQSGALVKGTKKENAFICVQQ
ncbi:hypothetical protein [Pseudomonas sp. USHLN015]|uniref:hypothetical protein n=1 Tax=Pseudomonas sp. USHLN015 TaxID=3081296 RepID=UPI00301D0DB6